MAYAHVSLIFAACTEWQANRQVFLPWYCFTYLRSLDFCSHDSSLKVLFHFISAVLIQKRTRRTPVSTKLQLPLIIQNTILCLCYNTIRWHQKMQFKPHYLHLYNFSVGKELELNWYLRPGCFMGTLWKSQGDFISSYEGQIISPLRRFYSKLSLEGPVFLR